MLILFLLMFFFVFTFDVFILKEWGLHAFYQFQDHWPGLSTYQVIKCIAEWVVMPGCLVIITWSLHHGDLHDKLPVCCNCCALHYSFMLFPMLYLITALWWHMWQVPWSLWLQHFFVTILSYICSLEINLAC